jgi:hypothetical protein
LLLLGPALTAQLRDQLVVNSAAPGVPPIIRIYDRKLNELSATSLASQTTNSISEYLTYVAMTSDGQIWIPIDPLNKKKLVRMDQTGALLPSVLLNHYPVALVTKSPDDVLALTRVPLSAPGPVYVADISGSILWTNASGPASFTDSYCDALCVTSGGEVWIAGNTDGDCGCEMTRPRVARLDPSTGDMVDSFYLAPPNLSKPVFKVYLFASPDGTCWITINDTAAAIPRLYNFNAQGVQKSFTPASISDSSTPCSLVDSAGDVWVAAKSGTQHLIRKLSQQDGSVTAEYNVGGPIAGFAFGSSGEDLFAVIGLGTPNQRKLLRMCVATGIKSSRQIDPPAYASGIGLGDPCGFIYANVVDQNGDNDRDGWTNRQETQAGSSPYDALSRPNGPKVYVSFAPVTNAISVTYRDPDGLVDPQGGLDVSSLSLSIGSFGNVFNLLLSFATSLSVNAELTEATLTFGALPLPNNKKWQVEARVQDLTGAVGWDWQVTPPGDL